MSITDNTPVLNIGILKMLLSHLELAVSNELKAAVVASGPFQITTAYYLPIKRFHRHLEVTALVYFDEIAPARY